MRRRVLLLTVVTCVTAVMPAFAAPAPPTTAGTPTVQELQRLREQMAAADGDLAAIDAALAAATGELDAIEGRLAAAGEDLTAVRSDLAAAEAAHQDASDAAAAATATLVDATAVLDRARAEFAARDEALASRVRTMWKGGTTDPGMLLLEGLARSGDLRDITMTMRTVDNLIEDDRELVDDAVTAAHDEAAVRAEVAVAQREARRLEARAAAERTRVAALVDQQVALVTAIDGERQAKAAVLATIEADRLAAARLVETLRAQVAALSAQLAHALLDANPDAVFDGPMPAWAAGLPPRGRQLAPAIAGAAATAGVDERLLAALVWSESNFHPAAVSHAGAIGLAQLMPGTAAGLGVDPWDPIQNLVGGARYLRAQLVRFGSADLALAAYNAGPGRVIGAGNQVPQITETQVYVLRVLGRYESLVAFG